jgi:hypothetical protein
MNFLCRTAARSHRRLAALAVTSGLVFGCASGQRWANFPADPVAPLAGATAESSIPPAAEVGLASARPSADEDR